MRSLLVLAAALALPSASFAEPRRDVPSRFADQPSSRLDCVVNRVQHAAPRKPLRPRTLDRLPPGQLYHSVERQVDGCREFVLVSEERRRR